MEARDIFQSEVAALALGMRTALQLIPIENRQRILILTDSNSALSFYTGKEIDHPHYRVLQNLVQDIECNDNNISVDGDGGEGKFVKMAKVKSAKTAEDGFFDHDVTDVLSSFVKKVSNKDMEKLYSRQHQNCDKTGLNKWGETDQSPSSLMNNCLRFVECNRLTKEDLKYLKNSMVENENKVIKKRQILMKKESGERLKRCKERIFSEIGILLD